MLVVPKLRLWRYFRSIIAGMKTDSQPQQMHLLLVPSMTETEFKSQEFSLQIILIIDQSWQIIDIYGKQ